MFSFFRKSKKEPDSNGVAGGPSKKPKDKEPPSSSASPGARNNHKETRKNIQNAAESAPQCANVSVVASVATEAASETASAAVTEPKTTKNDDTATMSVSSKAQVYAKMLRTLEPPKEGKPLEQTHNKGGGGGGGGVKPCGHGTVAIAPKIPLSINKRDNQSTPPDSPKAEARSKLPFYKPPNEKPEQLHNNHSHQQYELVKTQPINDTVTGVMKLRVDLPSSSPVSASPPPVESEKKNLINQEAKFQSQLNDLSKQLSVRDAEANKLRFQMEELQRDVFAKSAGIDRLQAELQTAQKESETTRQKLRHLENELAEFRQKNQELQGQLGEKDESRSSYENQAATKIAELENVVKELELKIDALQKQVEVLDKEKEQLQEEHAKLVSASEEEKQRLQKTVEDAIKEKEVMDQKWQKDFEQLRTINIMKEQQLLDDFEWKLREVEQKCKKRVDDINKKTEERLQDALKDAYERKQEAEKLIGDVEHLKGYEEEVQRLRNVTREQEENIAIMIQQQEEMKVAEETLTNETKRLRTLIEIEKENLQHMQRIHHQEILERERKLQQTLSQKKTEIAMFWEEKLLTECARLKTELEQMHNEEKYSALEAVKREKDGELARARSSWEKKVQDCLKEIDALKQSLKEKEVSYHDELMRKQTDTDRDIMELRRVMDKIDMSHHERFEKMVQQHEEEIGQLNAESDKKMKEVEAHWQNQVTAVRASLDAVKEQMERESQQKIEALIQQHRSELDTQWANLIHQKSTAIKLVEEEYVTKLKTLEEQFYTQQKSHAAREVELLKTIDTLKNDLQSKDSTIDDLQNNVDTLEGGVQVLNNEIAQQGDQLIKGRQDADHQLRNLQEAMAKLQEQHEQEREEFRNQISKLQKQSQTSMDHLQRKCQCLTKLFEEVRSRYERRESRQEDLTLISDLRQVIAEQEKDLACMNEEKRYFQMKLMNLEKSLQHNSDEEDEDTFVEAIGGDDSGESVQNYPNFLPQLNGPLNSFSIPPTILECDDCDE